MRAGPPCGRVGVLAAVAVRHEDVAGRAPRDDVARLVQVHALGVVARLPGDAEPHELFALGGELDDLVTDLAVALRVGDPDVAVVVDVDPVRQHEEPGAELGHQIARVPVVLQNRIHGRVGRAAAGEREAAATVIDPDVPVGRVDVDAGGRAPRPVVGQLGPVQLDHGVRVRKHPLHQVGLSFLGRRAAGAERQGQQGHTRTLQNDPSILRHIPLLC